LIEQGNGRDYQYARGIDSNVGEVIFTNSRNSPENTGHTEKAYVQYKALKQQCACYCETEIHIILVKEGVKRDFSRSSIT